MAPGLRGTPRLITILTILTVLNGGLALSHVFDDMTETEMQQVIDYICTWDEVTIGDQDKAGLTSPFIRMVETLSPEKAAVLDYLDNGGPRPDKRAIALLYRGDLSTPVVEEYIIWPVPNPTNHTLVTNPRYQDPIPFNARSPLNSVELPLISARMAQEFSKVDHILLAATGYSFNDCSNRCLEIARGGPAHVTPGGRTFLGYLIRSLEGKYLLPIGLQFSLNITALDAEDWQVNEVWWRGRIFKSFDVLGSTSFDDLGLSSTVQGVHSNNVAKDAFTDNLRSSLNFRGDPRPSSNQRGPRTSYPDGDRIEVTGRQVSWLGWTFNFNVRSSTGIQVHDMRFLKERIIYELSLQELAVFYSGGDPVSRHTTFYNSDAMLGWSGSQLFRGVDCPDQAHFFNTVHYHNLKPLVFPNTVCVFEWDRGIPLRRHFESNYNGGYKFFQGMPDNVLILRTIPTIDNYDYVVDVMLHQDGKVEVKVSLTGYLITTYYQERDPDIYGYQVMEDVIGNIHLHAANFRVDLDILGTANSVSTLDITLEEVDDSLNTGVILKNRRFTTDLKENEQDALYRYDFDTPRYIVFTQADRKNQYDVPRGYRLYIADPVKMLWEDDYRGNRAWAWAKYQMAVSAYDENEQRSSSLFNFEEPFDPVFSLEDYVSDNQTIVDKDLVAWVTLGAHHIPHTEDVPIVTTPDVQLTFYLLPFNFFDEDPSLASRDNLRVEPGENGDYIVHHSGVPGDKFCDRANFTCKGVSGTSTADATAAAIAATTTVSYVTLMGIMLATLLRVVVSL